MNDTVFATATGLGRAAVAVIRLSGPAAGPALKALAGPLPAPRRATLRPLCDATGEVLDRALVLWFPAPDSFTGQDSAEIQCHGGRAVVTALLQALAAQPGCRLALPGEFTRRALLNGKMSLAEVEGLADLIAAETEAQRRHALRQTGGGLADWVAAQRSHLINARAAAESAIDFADEGDVAGDFVGEVQRHVTALRAAIGQQRAGAARAARVREGYVVALVGAPNVGKSTVLNWLARRDVAIVSPWPGTTRDPVAVELDLDGYLVEVVDTAGLRPTTDPVEQEGIARTRARAASADLVLWLSEARAPEPPDPALQDARLWRVHTKADLGRAESLPPGHVVAAATGEGLPALLAALAREAGDQPGEGAIATRERHRAALAEADAALARIAAGGHAVPLELAAEQLREVERHLDSIVGCIVPDEVLDVIFSRFCVGK